MPLAVLTAVVKSFWCFFNMVVRLPDMRFRKIIVINDVQFDNMK